MTKLYTESSAKNASIFIIGAVNHFRSGWSQCLSSALSPKLPLETMIVPTHYPIIVVGIYTEVLKETNYDSFYNKCTSGNTIKYIKHAIHEPFKWINLKKKLKNTVDEQII